jgi:hypothetical protein
MKLFRCSALVLVALSALAQVNICTKHDRYPDGKEFVGVGIQPGVPAALDAALKLQRK